MMYALWDIETNNLIAESTSLNEALALVRRGIERNGPGDTTSLMLEFEDEHGDARLIAYGAQLAERALRGRSDTIPYPG